MNILDQPSGLLVAIGLKEIDLRLIRINQANLLANEDVTDFLFEKLNDLFHKLFTVKLNAGLATLTILRGVDLATFFCIFGQYWLNVSLIYLFLRYPMRVHGLQLEEIIMGGKQLHEVRLIIQTRLVVMFENAFFDFIPDQIKISAPSGLLEFYKMVCLLSNLDADFVLEGPLELLTILDFNEVYYDIFEILILLDALVHEDLSVQIDDLLVVSVLCPVAELIVLNFQIVEVVHVALLKWAQDLLLEVLCIFH